MPLPQHSSPGSRLRGGPWRHQKSKHKASTETITLRCCTVPDKHTRPTPLDAHAVLPELGQASGTGGPLGDSRSVQRGFVRQGAAIRTFAVETTHLDPARSGFRIDRSKPT